MVQETYSLKELAQSGFPVVEEIIGSGVLVSQTKAVLYGIFKSGKSTLAQYIAMCLAGGLPLFGYPKDFKTKKGKVFVVQLEMPYKAYSTRLLSSSLSNIQEVQDNLYVATKFFLKLDQHSGVEWLRDQITSIKPMVVIIDPIYKCVSGSENSVEDFRRLGDNMDIMMEDLKFSLLFTAQGRKTQILPKGGSVDLGDQELRGTTAIADWVDSIIGLRRAAGNKRKLTMTLRHGVKESLDIMVEWDKSTGLYKMV